MIGKNKEEKSKGEEVSSHEFFQGRLAAIFGKTKTIHLKLRNRPLIFFPLIIV